MGQPDTGFADLFGRAPDGVWAAPGRVNIIGEHTDYNDGFVLPIALPHRVVASVARRDDDLVRVASRQQANLVELPLAKLEPGSVDGWAGYVLGVCWVLASDGFTVGGLDILVDGDVPQGAGLSSSAALECATALAIAELSGLDLDRQSLARIAQRAENDFVGMPCGILDQSASLLCEQGHALLMDTRTLDIQQVPFDLADEGLTLLVLDTQAPHRHVDGEYATRRRTCERAAATLGLVALRDLAPDQLDEALTRLDDPVVRRRVHHVVTENARVLDTVAQLRTAGPRMIAELLTQSHCSLRDDYEVTVPEVDTVFKTAIQAGALGARITGGGFGGCVIALVETGSISDIVAKVSDAATAAGFAEPVSFVAEAAPGARRVS